MGGWDSMITPETKNILVEAAWFDPAAVRRSLRRHGLHTDASHRFERGADIAAAPIANALVSQLILQAGGHAEGPLIDVLIPEIAARTAHRPPITLSVQQVQRHLGKTLADSEPDTPTNSALTPGLIHQYLTALGCTLTTQPTTNNQQPTIFSVQLPSWRLDLEREIDLIEEVARVYGYNRFADTLPAPLPVIAHPTAAKEAAVRARLLALGYSESISSTFASQSDATLFHAATNPGPPTTNPGAPSFAPLAKGGVSSEARPSSSAAATIPGAPTEDPGTPSSAKVGHRAEHDPLSPAISQPVPLENPLSEEASLLRPSLIPGMLNMLAHNLNRDTKDVRLFEQGHIFSATIPPGSTIIEAVHESPQLSLGLTGNVAATERYTAESPHFFELKGAIESILSLFDLTSSTQTEDRSFRPEAGPPASFAGRGGDAAHFAAAAEKPAAPFPPAAAVTFTPEAPAWLQPGRCATAFLNNQPIAHLGELATTEATHRKLRQPVFLAQLDLAKLYDLPLKKITAHDLSRFQAVERDFSFVFPGAVQWHAIASALQALAIPELQSFKPAEVWRDPKKFPGVYSLLLRTVFQSHDRTLRDDELTAWSSALIAALTTLGGALRAAGEK